MIKTLTGHKFMQHQRVLKEDQLLQTRGNLLCVADANDDSKSMSQMANEPSYTRGEAKHDLPLVSG